MYVAFANQIKIYFTARTRIHYVNAVRKVGMKLMGRPNGRIASKMTDLVLTREEFCTTLFHLYFPDTNIGKCKVWIV